ncbi:MAG: hypothetical protein IKK34_05655 [Clostridia bacterium]|nr:hypothetical protein [Clostridia bacterium]
MSSFSLRLIALLCMIADHAGLALFPNIGAFRCAGRLAFPLYCFLLAQGFIHTRSVRAYGRRLLLLALISEIPFDLLIFGRVASGIEQNVLFSLLFGLMALYAADALHSRPLLAGASAALLCMGAMLCRVSYGWLGVILCLCVYYAQENKRFLSASLAAALLVYSLSLLCSGVTMSWVLVSLCALFSLIPLLFYNGKRGLRHPALTFAFYAAYPLHIACLLVIRALRIIPPYFLG